jgi:hypothetical protein
MLHAFPLPVPPFYIQVKWRLRHICGYAYQSQAQEIKLKREYCRLNATGPGINKRRMYINQRKSKHRHPPNATKGEKESKMLRVLCLRVPDPQKQKEKEKNMPYPKTQKPLCCMPLKSLPR